MLTLQHRRDHQIHQKSHNLATTLVQVHKYAGPGDENMVCTITSMVILHPCIDTTTPLFPLNENDRTSLSTTG